MKCWGYGRNGQLGQGDLTSDIQLESTFQPFNLLLKMKAYDVTLQGTKISPTRALLKMIFLSPRWDMLIFMFLFFHQTWVVISKIKFSSRSLGKLSNLTSIFFKGVETTNYSYYVNQEVSTKVSIFLCCAKSHQLCQVVGPSFMATCSSNKSRPILGPQTVTRNPSRFNGFLFGKGENVNFHLEPGFLDVCRCCLVNRPVFG